MIVTVTMNPAIDKTVEVSSLLLGGLNRITKVEYDVGGKGINVSKTIHKLGGESVATGFLAGNAGKTIENVLKENGIAADFVWVEGETRTNTKVYEKNGEVTELNEPGPVISKRKLEDLLEKMEGYAREDCLFVLAGSIPGGVEKGIYQEIIEHLHAKGAKVLLDADGELFRNSLIARPDIIKPNRAELEEYAGFDYRASEEELASVARGLRDKEGILTVAISMGKGGAMFIHEKDEARCKALSVKTHSTVGAGDAMVAALSYAWEKKLSFEDTVRLCMASSAGAVTTVGTKPPEKELVEELKKLVVLEALVS